MGKGGVLAAKGRFKGSKGSEGGPNCSTSQTSDRRTILAQLRHPKVRKHTPAPLEPPPASTNAVGRVTTSTKKDLGDALISPLAIHPHEPKAAQNDLAHASFVPTEPPPAPAPTLTHQRPAALPHPAKPKSVRETRPARADVSSRGHSQHKTTAPPPHRLSRVLSFLDLSLSLSLHPQTTPRVSPSSPFDTPPTPPTSAHNRHHGLLRRRQARDQHDPRPGCAYYPSSLNNSSRLHPAPAIPLVLLLCPTINGWGAKKKRQWCSLHRTTAMRGVG